MLMQFVVENFRSFREGPLVRAPARGPRHQERRPHRREPEEGTSAPRHVLARLDAFASRYRMVDGLDELWLVIDVDRWPEQQLSEVAQQCVQKPPLLRALAPAPCHRRHRGHRDLRRLRGRAAQDPRLVQQSRGSTRRPITRAAVESAIARARVLDTSEADRRPRATGSHVMGVRLHTHSAEWGWALSSPMGTFVHSALLPHTPTPLQWAVVC
jgi:hypothetical protein